MIKQQFEISAGYKKWTNGLLAVGALALVLGFIFLGMSSDENAQTRFWAVLLQNSVFFLLVVNAAMFFICVTTLAMGGWQVAFRRVPEAISTLVPVFGVLALLVFIGIIFGHKDHVYHWINKEHVEADAVLKGKKSFLNPTFFFVWTLITLGVWSAVGYKMRQLSARTDESMDLEEAKAWVKTNSIWASVFTVFFGLTVASTIPWLWLMSIDAHWYSTMYSWYTFVSTFVSGMSLIAIFVVYLKQQDYLEYVNEEHLHDLGKFMFAFSIFWTYLWYSQFMLIWYANIPEESVYYVLRSSSSWKALGIILVVGHFLVPFVLLLFRAPKASAGFLGLVAGWILAMHLLDVYTMVLPVLHPEGFQPAVLDVASLLAIGCTLGAVFLKQLGDSPLWPSRDPRLAEAANYTD